MQTLGKFISQYEKNMNLAYVEGIISRYSNSEGQFDFFSFLKMINIPKKYTNSVKNNVPSNISSRILFSIESIFLINYDLLKHTESFKVKKNSIKINKHKKKKKVNSLRPIVIFMLKFIQRNRQVEFKVNWLRIIESFL